MIRVTHTSGLEPSLLPVLRQLLDEAFDGDFSDDDWDHSLGGVHALVYDGADLVGHGAVVQRRLLHGGKSLRTGYVEGVAVRADARRRGHGATVMAALEDVVRRGYVLGALAAAEDAVAFYAGRGWLRWRGPSSVLGPRGVERTEDDDGALFVLPVAVRPDLDGPLVCDWRDGDVW
ncbi:GNAT family N-acetyltransferase [Actinosynnema sp. NPDC020468]|uniref:GNAT family N-acetyltransferase n=1 Tax=Actinosynnema sp. NPDC020468 TaxID=3154488 RepID=UPI0033C29934